MRCFIILVFALAIFSGTGTLKAQDSSSNIYYESYPNLLTTRLYSVTKFNSIQFISDGDNNELTYRPNTNMNVGFGFNYRSFGLNLGFNLPSVNNDDEKYGTTTHFNLDANTYAEKITFTAFFQYYKGYYESSSDELTPPFGKDESLSKRRDISFFSTGVSGVYLFNNKKVSFRSSFTQDEWQKKSAGSIMMGGYLTYNQNNADSVLFISNKLFHDDSNIVNKVGSFDVGPLVGYMYNFIVNKHWFFTISLGAGIGYNRLHVSGENGYSSYSNNINYRLQERAGFGWNSNKFYAGISYVNENNRVLLTSGKYGYNIGNFRLNVVYRFNAKMGGVDKFMDFFPWFFQEKQEDQPAVDG